MSFTLTNTVLLAALACALSANVCAAGGSMEECADYAEKAFFTVDDMKRIKCGEVDRSGGPGRFTVNYDEHFDWCRRYSTPQARASETQARNDAKNACSAKPESKAQKARNDMCKRYSDNALRVSSDMKELKCEEIGSMWDTRYSLASNHHRDWCLNESTPQTLQFEKETRTAAANACKARKAKEVSCQEYATNPVQRSNSYQISRCTTEGHVFREQAGLVCLLPPTSDRKRLDLGALLDSVHEPVRFATTARPNLRRIFRIAVFGYARTPG